MHRMKQQPPRLTDEQMESVLERIITDLIARDLKMNRNDVTPEFIRRWRQEHLYPAAPVKTETNYGGYNGSKLRVLTGNQIASHREKAMKFLLRFS